MSKKILLMAILSIFLYTEEGKTGSVTVNCFLDENFMGQLAPVQSSSDPGVYKKACDDNFPSQKAPNSDCENNCTPEVVSSSPADPVGEMRVIPAENMSTLSSPTAPAREESQTSAPAYQPQEEQTQNFHRPVTQGEGPEIPSNPTRDLKLAPIDREAQE